MAVISQGSRSRVADLFDLAVEQEVQVAGMMTALEQVHESLTGLTVLYPESLSFGGPDSQEDDK